MSSTAAAIVTALRQCPPEASVDNKVSSGRIRLPNTTLDLIPSSHPMW